MSSKAERYLHAHGHNFATNDHQTQPESKSDGEITTNQRQRKECYNCGKPGHIRSECRNERGGNQQHCTKCNRFGHKDETCRRTTDFGGMIRTNRLSKLKPERRQIADNLTKIRHCQERKGYMETLKATKGRINDTKPQHCETLDHHCMCKWQACITQTKNRKIQNMHTYHGTQKRLIATVDLDTPYIKQNQVSVMCVKKLQFDIVVSDVPGARCKWPNMETRWQDKRRQDLRIQSCEKQIPIWTMED